jgi:mannan endo-1,4-beta-mannosidase
MRFRTIGTAIIAAAALAGACAAPGDMLPSASAAPVAIHQVPAGSAAGRAAAARPASAQLAAAPDSVLGLYAGGVHAFGQVSRFGRAVGRQPNVVMYFSAWGNRFNTAFARTARRHGAVPFVELQPASVSMQSIAAGRSDRYLRSYARAVRRFGHPVLLGFAHEMNGFWYPWGWKHTRPAVFVRAWRHVVTVFRRAGASNVSWLWVVNSVTGMAPVREWWPGSQYVTWVAMDCYYVQRTDTFAKVFGPTIAALRRITSKPELIAETGIGADIGRAAKIPGLFAGIRARHLLGLVYYDKTQHNGTYHQDWQVDYDQPAMAAFRSSIERYLI